MNPNPRFLAQLRQYNALETRMNQDFSSPVVTLSYLETDRLIASGMSEENAFAHVNQVLANEMRRFPVTVEPIPF